MDAPYRESADKSHRPARVLIREYRWPGDARVLWASLPFLCVVVWEAWKVFFAPETARSETGFSTLMTFLLMGVSIAYIVHRAYGAASDAVRLYEDGVTMQKDGTATEIRWDEASTLTSEAFRDPRGRPGQRHVLASTRGATMTVTHAISEIDELAAELRERVAERVLPRAIMALRAGTSQSFGPIRVERDGVAWAGRELVPWRDIGRADALLGAVTLRHGGESTRFDRVPNAHVLAALVEHARGD